MQRAISIEALAELAPLGKLRVGINHGNFLLVTPGSPFGAPTGIAPDLALELGRKAGLAVEFVSYDGAGKLADAVKDAEVDVGFLGNERERADAIAFSPAYLELPVTYLVPAGSPIARLEDVDREGVRIAVSARSAYDLFLSRELKHAQLVRAEGIPASAKLFAAEKLEALAGLKPGLMEAAGKLPGSRILEGQVTAVQQSIGAPKLRSAAAAFLREFVEEAKRSGLVRRLVEKHGIRGINVAPPA
jgi:polar amino acid transport system substrate-binding protein